jgi:hypothetical protein
MFSVGRAIDQAVSRWLPTAAVRGSRPGHVVDKVAPGQVSSEYFGFPCQIHSTNCSKNHHHQSIIGEMYNRPNGQTSMAAVQGPNRHLGTQDRPRQTELGHLQLRVANTGMQEEECLLQRSKE